VEGFRPIAASLFSTLPVIVVLVLVFFFLPAISAARNPLSESVFVLQGYYIDHIGGVDNRFTRGNIGIDVSALNFDKSLFLETGKRPIRVSNPFWPQSLDNSYHFTLPKRIVFNFTSFAKLDPPSIFIPLINILTTRPCNFSITNVDPTNPLEILEVSSSSRDLLLSAIDPTTLRPGDSLQITVFLISCEPRPFSALILVRTSKGTIPYLVTCRSVISRQDTMIPRLFHYSSGFPVDISLKIPPIFQHKFAILYDAGLFVEARQSDRSVVFCPVVLKPGHYLTFVHLITEPVSRTFPLCICSSQKLLQPFYPIIYLEMVTSPKGFSESIIQIANPTPLDYQIISIVLAREAPPNVRLEAHDLPLLCRSLADTVVGKVILSGSRAGEVDTAVVVTYEINDKRVEQVIDIPVRGSVEYGSFEPSSPAIELFQTKGNSQSIYFTNNFNVPVVVAAARLDSPHVRVVNFTPFVVPPKQRSPDLRVKYTFSTLVAAFDTILYVDTNATNLRIPVWCYNGHITVSEKPDFTEDPSEPLFFRLGRTLCGSSVEKTLYVRNPNPDPYLLTSFSATPGIQATGQWQTDDAGGLRSHSLAPFSAEKIFIRIRFAHIESTQLRNDTLSLGGVGSLAHIIISWIPHAGSLQVSTTLPPVIFPGKRYNATVYVNSSYSIPRKVIGAFSQRRFLAVFSMITYIRPNATTAVAALTMMFLPEVMEQFTISEVFRDYRNYSYQVRAWGELWSSPLQVEVGFFLHLHPDSKIRVSFGIVLGRSSFQDVDMPAGYILPRTNITQFLDVRNNHDCAVAFHGSSFDAVAGPGETISVPIRFAGTDLGCFTYYYPITTNITAPFYLNISGVVVLPKLRYVDAAGTVVKELWFGNGIWVCDVYLVNRGRTGVFLDFAAPRKVFRVRTNCSDSLDISELCQLRFAVQFDDLENESEVHFFLVKSAGVTSELKLIIELTKDGMKKLMRRRLVNYIGNYIILSVFTIGRILRSLFRWIRRRNDRRWRLRRIPKAIEKRSVARRLSTGTEVIFTQERTGGVWVPAAEIKHEVSGEALTGMATLIADLL
jgi:hypothetical protein